MTQEVLVNNRWEDACQYIRGGATKRTKGGKGKGKKKGGPSRKGIGLRKSDAVGKSSAVPVNQLSDELKEAAFPAPFYCNRSTVKVKANSTATITVDFLPLKPGTYRCQLIFLDERVGETMYEVIGKASVPKPMQSFPVTIEMSSSVQRHLSIPFHNSQLESAREVAMKRYAGSSLKKMRDALKMYIQNTPKQPQVFSIDFNSPFYQSVPECTVSESAESGAKERQSS